MLCGGALGPYVTFAPAVAGQLMNMTSLLIYTEVVIAKGITSDCIFPIVPGSSSVGSGKCTRVEGACSCGDRTREWDRATWGPTVAAGGLHIVAALLSFCNMGLIALELRMQTLAVAGVAFLFSLMGHITANLVIGRGANDGNRSLVGLLQACRGCYLDGGFAVSVIGLFITALNLAIAYKNRRGEPKVGHLYPGAIVEDLKPFAKSKGGVGEELDGAPPI